MRATDITLGWRWSENNLSIQTPAGTLVLTPLMDDLIRLRIEATGGKLVLPTDAIIKTDWQPPHDAAVADHGDHLTLTSGGIKVEIDLAPVRLRWYDGDRLFAVDHEIGIAPDRILLRRQMPQDEHYYGFGQKIGYLDKRGRKMEMWATDDPNHTPTTDPLYQSIPFFISLRGGQA
ncbi:MAG TPA: hypothetical protein VD973_09010, partial [Symbiobacteriaceae bacterium]|nr:hypothetical protein [Symbiobacteriaceae bacterium]